MPPCDGIAEIIYYSSGSAGGWIGSTLHEGSITTSGHGQRIGFHDCQTVLLMVSVVMLLASVTAASTYEIMADAHSCLCGGEKVDGQRFDVCRGVLQFQASESVRVRCRNDECNSQLGQDIRGS